MTMSWDGQEFVVVGSKLKLITDDSKSRPFSIITNIPNGPPQLIF